MDPDNLISLTTFTELVELEENQVEQFHIITCPNNFDDPIQKKNLDLTLKVQNKTVKHKSLNSSIMQIDENDKIQSLSETKSQPELTPLNLLLETSCEIKLSENFDDGDSTTWSLTNDKFRLFIIDMV